MARAGLDALAAESWWTAHADAVLGTIVGAIVTAIVLLLYGDSLAVLDAERHHVGANINNFGDALWWSATTITTVGYGDQYPSPPPAVSLPWA